MDPDLVVDRNAAPSPRVVLRLRGEFATATTEGFSAAVDRLIAGGDVELGIDMRRVDYINSTALGALVRAHRAAEERGGSFEILAASPFVLEMLRTVGLDRVFEMPMELDDSTTPRSHVVVFSFDDDRADLLSRGDHPRSGVGTIRAFGTESMAFSWDASRHDLAPDELHTLFDPGSPIHLRFGVKLARKDRFRLDGRIDSWTESDDRTVEVRVLWSQLPADARSALTRFEADMRSLRADLDDAAETD